MPDICKAAFGALAKKVRENPGLLRDLSFPDASTSKTVIKTQDLRLDVHKDTQDSTKATGIIQANTEATDKSVKEFARKNKTGGHRGTHQVIGEKSTLT